jgi:hypothetical protein
MIAALAALGTFLLPTASLAEPFAISVGQTKTMTVPVPMSSVTSDDRGVLSVRKFGQAVEIVGHTPGKTSFHVRTAEGEKLDFCISVVNTGSTVYEVSAGPRA